MAIPPYNKLMPIILKQMQDDREYKRTEMFESLQPSFTKEELAEIIPASSVNKLLHRIGWAFTFLTKAEFIEKSTNRRASYFITPLGREALKESLAGKEMNEAYFKAKSPNYIKNWEVVRIQKNGMEQERGEAGEFNLEEALEEIKQNIEIDFITKLRSLDWRFFEDFCAELIEKMGYGVRGKREIRVRDGGIDGVIYTDELGIKDKIYLQAKRYSEGANVASKDMQAFLHVITKANSRGIFITTSKFSGDTKEVARDYEMAGMIALIDDKKLIELCTKHKQGFKIKKIVELLEVDL